MEDFETYFQQLIINEEGGIRFYSFDSKKFSNTGVALKKSMPVFYNPIQEFNRSITLIAYKAFQQISESDKNFEILKICDSMAASGIRSIRLFKFLNKHVQIIANDLNPLALKIIQKNLALNSDIITKSDIELLNQDAHFLFEDLQNKRNYQSIIDIDPFGTPNIFIESAIKAVFLEGLIGITATDTAVLFGVRPSACLRKYNIKSLRSTFLKEVGLRILLYYAASRAHPHMNYIEPMLSFSSDHYIRVFIRIHKGKTGINKNYKNSGYIFWCRKCDWRMSIGMDLHEASFFCPICQSKVDYGGPLWIGSLNNPEFVTECIRTLENSEISVIPSKKKILKILNIILSEDKFPPGYYDLHKICDMLGISVAKKTELILESIRNLGYNAARTHIEPRAIKSNIPIEQLKKLLIDFHKKIVI
ncbi:tRNA (guanine(10)-N(2))-dimethyltransferase [Promethearchaeum syntrophicum]|uniref:tRNA (guanine(26)-N(2))-dimethyltransferase n=1 Tax=Promethearchaeum syntrophicum TaxID=2594042 RepID=A0A5B9D8P7_9ARCH|nr:tRNA (guanine(10)-N(2))-dimethyltransferase [Candidatus Prometheoarchaeum syntrophicum]QEE15375.1 tRNA (guanine(26)-N(2))-dimethyltransferase [Candidatus Prometheoarchaeum syntrophicum]